MIFPFLSILRFFAAYIEGVNSKDLLSNLMEICSAWWSVFYSKQFFTGLFFLLGKNSFKLQFQLVVWERFPQFEAFLSICTALQRSSSKVTQKAEISPGRVRWASFFKKRSKDKFMWFPRYITKNCSKFISCKRVILENLYLRCFIKYFKYS